MADAIDLLIVYSVNRRAFNSMQDFPLWWRRCLTTTNRFNNCFLGLITARPTQHLGIGDTSRAATWDNRMAWGMDTRASAEDMVFGRNDDEEQE